MKGIIRNLLAMAKTRRGSVYAFFLKERNQYGLIQALDKGPNGGRNVRIFYDLLDDLDDKTINSLIQSDRFYYLADFLPHSLVHSDKALGRFPIPDLITMPRFMREMEWQEDGRLFWYVMENLCVVKVYEQFDETLKSLSPASSWGIQYVQKRWIEDFTLENWHELAIKWYEDYLREYEPEKLPLDDVSSSNTYETT